MTTETESLRQKFERHIVATGRSEGELIFEAGHYLYPDVQEIWELYQAGHAAAIATQKTPAVNDNAGRWYMLANDGMATLCASEADALAEAADADAAWPRMAPHRAVQLVPADQLTAAADAEREKCAGIVNELRMECARRNMPESATMLWHAEDAIRAGANGANSD